MAGSIGPNPPGVGIRTSPCIDLPRKSLSDFNLLI